jgi:hypothetical protein
MASAYRRVPQDESGSSENLEANVTRSRGERLQDKLIARKRNEMSENWLLPHSFSPHAYYFILIVAWVALAYLVNRWTSFFSTLWNSNDANRVLLRISGAGMLGVLGMLLYLIVYLPRVKGLNDSSAWRIYCPKVVPSMIFVGLVSYFVFLRATWPLWGFLAPIVSGTQFMGILMALHFIPSMGLCY